MKKIRSLRRTKYFLFFLSMLLSYGVMFSMIIYAIIIGSPTQRFSLGFIIIFSLILLFVQWKSKHRCRSMLWLILCITYYILDNIYIWLIIICACTIIDELIVDPLYNYTKEKLGRVLTAKEVYDYKD